MLKICYLSKLKSELGLITDTQIETFCQGCPHLNELRLDVFISPIIAMCNKLFRSLGSHNPYLVNLTMFYSRLQPRAANVQRIGKESIRCLVDGCPLLSCFSTSKISFSTQALTYLVNHSIHLETLCLHVCSVCDDGLVITKEADKLKHLRRLELALSGNITDESIISLVSGCHNLEEINIFGCPNPTDNSLFSIATNCPQLKWIGLDFKGNNVTIGGLKELLTKCPHLIDIDSISALPEEIKEELLHRRAVYELNK